MSRFGDPFKMRKDPKIFTTNFKAIELKSEYGKARKVRIKSN